MTKALSIRPKTFRNVRNGDKKYMEIFLGMLQKNLRSCKLEPFNQKFCKFQEQNQSERKFPVRMFENLDIPLKVALFSGNSPKNPVPFATGNFQDSN